MRVRNNDIQNSFSQFVLNFPLIIIWKLNHSSFSFVRKVVCSTVWFRDPMSGGRVLEPVKISTRSRAQRIFFWFPKINDFLIFSDFFFWFFQNKKKSAKKWKKTLFFHFWEPKINDFLIFSGFFFWFFQNKKKSALFGNKKKTFLYSNGFF